MEAVIKVILHACKLHCGKQTPSKKEVTAVLLLLEKEGLLVSPSDLYNPDNWDRITTALSQRTLAIRRVSEFKVWGFILEALKAAREEKLAIQCARELLGLEAGGNLVSSAGSEGAKMAPTPSIPPNASPSRTIQKEVAQDRSDQDDTQPPPPYPARNLYPSLKPFRDEGGGRPPEECGDVSNGADNSGQRVGGTSPPSGSACQSVPSQKGADHSAPQDSEHGCGCGDLKRAAQEPAQGGCGPTAPPLVSLPTLTDWARATEDLQAADPATTFALPIVVKQEGSAWTPLDTKAITRLAELVKNKGLRSPVTMSAAEALMASSLLPYDVTNLMRVILEPVQYTLWYDEWNRLLQVVVAEANRNADHPANEREGEGRGARVTRTTLPRLLGLADGMVGSPDGQARTLRAGELAALTTAALTALRTVAKVAEPVLPWTDIKQEPSESFSDFANRLLRAVEGSDLPEDVQSLVVIDCLKQRSLPEIQQIIRAAPGTLTTPGQIIKYVLDHQKSTPLTSESFATASPLDPSPLSLGGGECGRAVNSSGWRSRRVPDPGGAQTWCYPRGGSSQVRRGPTGPAAASCSLAVAPAACLSCRGQGLESPARSRSAFRHRAAGCCREFRLPLALNTAETLTVHGPVLSHDTESLACVILKWVQYTLWKEGWMTELGRVLAAEQDDSFHPVHGIVMQGRIGAECLGYKFSPEIMQLVGLDIQPHVKTLWDVQNMVGTLQWVRSALGMPSGLRKPLYSQLKGSNAEELKNRSNERPAVWQKIVQSCMEGSLVQHETLSLRAMIWQDSNSSWQAAVFTNRKVSVQMLEVMAVTAAVHLWRMIPSNIVADSIFAVKQLARMGQEGLSSTEAAGTLEEALVFRTAPVAPLRVCDHSGVPSLLPQVMQQQIKLSAHLSLAWDRCRSGKWMSPGSLACLPANGGLLL
ncbi:uncharacterized protein [Excalfactoria chinensis]|uniref:uncharacterized protein n=1 Tax=Excalfactoria chinensis TaxID=46218 RepID=UPI003B3B8DAC